MMDSTAATDCAPAACRGRYVDAAIVARELLDDHNGLYRLDRAVVHGVLNLRHAQIKRPIEMTNCVFLDDVDTRYAEFNGAVEFNGCQFLGQFLSGDQSHTRTVYRKDLIFNASRFLDVVSFNRAYIEGNASFVGCLFNGVADGLRLEEFAGEADFSGMQVERNLICNRAIFRRSVSFNALRCRTAEFHGTRFEGPDKDVDFRSAVLLGNIEFLDPQALAEYQPEEINEPPAGPGKPARPVVRGRMNLRGFKCDRRAIFTGVEFEGPVDCENADFGWYLDFRRACFKDRAWFTRVTCRGAGLFQDASFEYGTVEQYTSADFRYASFDSLEFSRAIFLGGIVLGQATIARKLRLDEARFESDVLLFGAKIGTIVLLNEGFSLKALSLYEDAYRDPADREYFEHRFPRHAGSCVRARKVADARLAEYHRLLSDVRRRPDFPARRERQPERLRVFLDRELRHNRHLLEQMVAYYLPFRHRDGAVPGLFWWGWGASSGDPTPDPRGLELNGCQFERIHAGLIPALADELIRAFVASQKIDRFSRDVYLQLEQHYRRTGNDQRASQVHLWGHLATRRNAACEAGAVRWSRLQRLGDLIMLNTGWGHQTWRIGIWCALIITVGAVFFADYDGALRESDAAGGAAVSRSSDTRLMDTLLPGVVVGTESLLVLEGCDRWDWECTARRTAYSLNTFIPAVSLGFEDDWVPASGAAEVVRFFLVVAGWVLVPLWAGSLTGFFKED